MDNEKFQNKYRITSARLQTWDYRWAGSYFITICTQNREHYFGEIQNGKMQLSHVGVIADILWYEIKNRAKNIELGQFVVMPNHIHGILILNEQNNEMEPGTVETGHALSLSPHAPSLSSHAPSLSSHAPSLSPHALSLSPHAPSLSSHAPSLHPLPPIKLPTEQTIGQQRFQNIGKNSISSIIGSYKSAVTKHAKRLGFHFAWQTRFHDHIIRDEKSFHTISEYIIHNPEKWEEDKFYQKESKK